LGAGRFDKVLVEAGLMKNHNLTAMEAGFTLE